MTSWYEIFPHVAFSSWQPNNYPSVLCARCCVFGFSDIKSYPRVDGDVYYVLVSLCTIVIFVINDCTT